MSIMKRLILARLELRHLCASYSESDSQAINLPSGPFSATDTLLTTGGFNPSIAWRMPSRRCRVGKCPECLV